jgi:lipoprotein NlpD
MRSVKGTCQASRAVSARAFAAVFYLGVLTAPATAFSGNLSELHEAPQLHVVSAGENLFRIALNHGLTTEQLAGANGIAPPYTIHPGQELLVPRSAGGAVVTSPQGGAVPNITVEYEHTLPRQSERTPFRAYDGEAPPPEFFWPARGRIVDRERTRRDGSSVPGWTIDVRSGSTVQAAAAGEVMYVGDGVPGFRNLILVRHNANWVTAYGNNDRIHVVQGAQVNAGDDIATAPRSLFGRRSEIYFEIRNGVTPVDPAQFLSLNIAANSTTGR